MMFIRIQNTLKRRKGKIMIGFVVLNYKNWEVTCECIQSIIDTVDIAYRIVVVDNGSNNDSVKILSERFKNSIEIISLEKNIGFSAGNNVGISHLNNDGIKYCILCNSDIIFKDGAVKELLKTIKANKDALLIGPKIYDVKGECQLSSLEKPVSILDQIYIGKFLYKKRINESEIDMVKKVFTVSGCCFIINIPLFIQTESFDEKVFLYNEENILGMKAFNNDLAIYFCPFAEVIHKHRASTNVNCEFIETEYIKSTLYYWLNYRSLSIHLARIIICFFNIRLKIKYRNNKEFCSRDVIGEAKRKLYELYGERE